MSTCPNGRAAQDLSYIDDTDPPRPYASVNMSTCSEALGAIGAPPRRFSRYSPKPLLAGSCCCSGRHIIEVALLSSCAAEPCRQWVSLGPNLPVSHLSTIAIAASPALHVSYHDMDSRSGGVATDGAKEATEAMSQSTDLSRCPCESSIAPASSGWKGDVRPYLRDCIGLRVENVPSRFGRVWSLASTRGRLRVEEV